MSTITLHPVTRATKASNRFCRPAVLSILTGLDTADTARLLRKVSGKRSIKGTATRHLHAALAELGIAVAPFPTHREATTCGLKPVTFVQWERRSRPVRGNDTILLVMGHHWAVVQGRRYACGISRAPVPFSKVPHRCARVTEAYRLTRVDTKPFGAPPPPAPKPPNPDRIEAQRLATLYGIRIEDGDARGEWWVWGPTRCYDSDGLWPDGEGDPLSGERFCTSWFDVLAAVRVYVDAIEASRVSTLQTAATPCDTLEP